MSLSSRLWRILRAQAGTSYTIDPDEVLEHLGRDCAAEPTPSRVAPDQLTRAYARLEIPVGASIAEAKAAWRRLMQQFHPDRFAQDSRRQQLAAEVAAALTEAYETIRRQRS